MMHSDAKMEILEADLLLARGLACSSGADGAEVDLIEAHIWFNLAALHGEAEAAAYRAEIAYDMTPRQINEAQRRARALVRDNSFLFSPKGAC